MKEAIEACVRLVLTFWATGRLGEPWSSGEWFVRASIRRYYQGDCLKIAITGPSLNRRTSTSSVTVFPKDCPRPPSTWASGAWMVKPKARARVIRSFQGVLYHRHDWGVKDRPLWIRAFFAIFYCQRGWFLSRDTLGWLWEAGVKPCFLQLRCATRLVREGTLGYEEFLSIARNCPATIVSGDLKPYLIRVAQNRSRHEHKQLLSEQELLRMREKVRFQAFVRQRKYRARVAAEASRKVPLTSSSDLSAVQGMRSLTVEQLLALVRSSPTHRQQWDQKHERVSHINELVSRMEEFGGRAESHKRLVRNWYALESTKEGVEKRLAVWKLQRRS